MPRAITWYLIVITVFLLFIAVNIQAGWLFVLDFILISFVASAWLLPVLWTAGDLRAERFAQRIFEGETAQVVLRLTNNSPFNKHFLIVEDVFPSKDSPEPVSVFLPSLPKRKTVELHYEMKGAKRGVYSFQSLMLRSLGPADLFEWKRRIPCAGELVVYPAAKPFALSLEESLPAPFPAEKGTSFGKGDGEDFYGIREYEPGDSLRSVHWPSSAKAGKLMIRDMMRAHPAVYTLYVDCDRKWEGDPFEGCVKAAAFAAQEILRQGHWLRFYAAGSAEPKDWWGSLNLLAAVRADEQLTLAARVKANLPLLLAQRQLIFFTVAPLAFVADDWSFVSTLMDGYAEVHFVLLHREGAAGLDSLERWIRAQGAGALRVAL